jgi:hypothetical protein
MARRRFDRAGGGASGVRGKKTTSEVGCAGVAGWAKCHLGRRGEKTKKIEMSRKDDWAEMVLGCAEKKKQVFQILIQGIIFKSKF